jgi:hypothetical protein
LYAGIGLEIEKQWHDFDEGRNAAPSRHLPSYPQLVLMPRSNYMHNVKVAPQNLMYDTLKEEPSDNTHPLFSSPK